MSPLDAAAQFFGKLLFARSSMTLSSGGNSVTTHPYFWKWCIITGRLKHVVE